MARKGQTFTLFGKRGLVTSPLFGAAKGARKARAGARKARAGGKAFKLGLDSRRPNRCTTCHARPYQPCRTPKGTVTKAHAARIAADRARKGKKPPAARKPTTRKPAAKRAPAKKKAPTYSLGGWA
jgi:hypothetical protein